MELKEHFKNNLTFNREFTEKNKTFIKSETKPKLINDICLKFKAKAPLHSWKYFERTQINEEEVVYEKDLDINSFEIKKEKDSLLIAIYGNNKAEALQQILNIFFNERNKDYDPEIGFSGFEIEENPFYMESDGSCIKVQIKEFKVLFYEESK